MNDFHFELMIAAPPADVFAALTTQAGLRNWWTRTCDVGGGVGARATFRFGKTYKIMEILVARPDSEIRWRCVDSQIHAPGLLQRTDEWKDTEIRFQLTPKPSGTLLQLDHIGLTPQIECYDLCTQGWRQFLGSLRAYLETGQGSPYTEPAA